MAYINVAEWSPDQVTDWIKGLDDSMYNYVYSFVNNGVGGHQLLNIRPYELEQLGMDSIGHQEIVLAAVENLRNFHYNLDKENLQFMALHVATAARSLHRQLSLKSGQVMIETELLNDITRSISTIKPLVGWLDRSPFQGQFQYTEICRKMLRLGLEMATIAQRERFVENPVDQIRSTAETLERLANYIIQDITDPMLLQPASLNLVTLKKRESELGFNIETSYHGIHRVTDIKHNSPAHNSGKIEDGDEIVQINYQTIVGWQYKTVLLQLRESLPDVLLTLKKRPKHTKIYGQIYMQPYRLPSKKRNVEARWGENVPSPPRPSFLTVPENPFKIPLTLNVENEKIDDVDTDSICSDILTPTDTKVLEKESRLYYPKPRAMLQRRNTICGDELIRHKYLGVVPHWLENRTGTTGDPSSPSLRDKSISFGFGLEITPRPTTCIGIGGGTNGKYCSDMKLFSDSKKLGQVVEQPNEELEPIFKPGVSKVVRFDSNMKVEDYPFDEKYTCNVQNTILETFEPIPFADEEDSTGDILLNPLNLSEQTNRSSNVSLVETVNLPLVARRGRLDKSHSTPAYDNSSEETEIPPAVEPRKDNHRLTPPVPPPRPRKQTEIAPGAVPVPPPKPPGLMATMNASATTFQATQFPPQQLNNSLPAACIHATVHQEEDEISIVVSNSTLSLSTVGEATNEIGELHTPTKSRVLTLKKKHSLISKRRNVNLKILGTGDIQGYLYRRTKDKRGVTFWARLYFVMLDTILYGFRLKEATKASCVIFLPGFTVSLAKEVHSKPYAFKVYHSAKTFYFAAESQDALSQWVDFIKQAALTADGSSSLNSSTNTDANPKELFSENESSSEENESVVAKNLCTPSPQAYRDVPQPSSSAKTKASTPSSSKSDRRYLGSLRKLTKGSLHFKSSLASDKKLSDIPVPTEQYRSYRKVPGGSFGIQIGANTPGYYDASTHPLNKSQGQTCTEQQQLSQSASYPLQQSASTVNSEIVISPPPAPTSLSQTHTYPRRIVQAPSNNCEFPTTHLTAPTPTAPPPTMSVKDPKNELSSQTHTPVRDELPTTTTQSSNVASPTRSVKKLPYNYIHASNPNLVEFDFQTSRTLDYNMPKINSSNAWDALPNIQGFVTLKDLMLQKQEEEAQEMYNNRVLLGVERKEEYKRSVAQRGAAAAMRQQAGESSQATETPKVSKTQSRSLPKPPDYEISFKPDDEDIQLTRTKEGLKLRDFGYELISGDEPLSSSSSNTVRKYLLSSRNIPHDPNGSDVHELSSHSSNNWTSAMKSRPFILSSNKNKKHSTASSCSSASNELNSSGASGGEKRSGSFKKKGKLDSFKTSSERIFQFGKHTSSSGSAAGITMTLPLNKWSHNMNDSSGTTSDCCGATGIKKSQTYNKDLKDKASKYDAQRKNSAPMPIFAKLSFSSGTSSSVPSSNSKSDRQKDKRGTGSPLLHRTVFNHHHMNSVQQGTNISGLNSSNTCTGRDYDQEIFAQVIFPKKTSRKQSTASSIATNDILSAPDITAPAPPTKTPNANANDVISLGTVASSTTTTTMEYPDMECPPVFEPDIYSLTDPNASLLLRRSNNNNPNTNPNNMRNRTGETENN